MQRSVDAIRAAYEEAVAAFAAIDDVDHNQAAFEVASILAAAVDDLATDAAARRRRCVQRIWDVEELSLAQLANRISVSKTRAANLVRSFTAPPTEGAQQ